MAYGNFGSQSKGYTSVDYTINQYENASANYKLIAASVADVLQFLNAPNGAEFNITVPTAAGGPGTTMTIRITNADSTGANAHSTASSPNHTIGIGGSGIVPLNAANAQTIAGQIIAAINDGTDGANITIGTSLTSGISGLIASAGSGTNGKITLAARIAGSIGNDILLQNVANTIVQSAPRNLEGGQDIQIPFSLGLSGVVPFNIGSAASKSAYTMTKGKQISTE
jgi:hypothetical protein